MANENVNIVIKAVDKTKGALTSVQKGLSAVKSSVFSLQGALLSLGAGAAVKSIITVASEVESLQIRLKFLTGSTTDAAKAFDTMNKFAAQVPFSLADIERASPSLLTVADDVGELNKLLAITGDIAAVSGLKFDEVAMQLQRAFSSGIASADLFKERGVAAFLGFQSGVSVSAEETKNRITKMWRDGTTTAVGATKDLSKSFMGQVSMMEDAWRELKLVVADAGVFEEAGKVIINITKALKDPAFKEGVQVFAKSLVSLFKFIVDNKDALVLVGSIYLGAKIGKAFGVIGAAIGAATAAFIAFNNEIKEFLGFAESDDDGGVAALNRKIASTLEYIGTLEKADGNKAMFAAQAPALKEATRNLNEYQLALSTINEEMLMSQALPKPANPVDVSTNGVTFVDVSGELTKAQELFQLQEQYGYLEQGRIATQNQAIKDAAEAQAAWIYEHNSGKEAIELGLAEAHQQKMLDMTHLYLQKQNAMKKASAAGDIDTLQESGKKVVGALSSQYKWAFDLHKSFAIKDALIDTYKAVSTAMSSAPPPLNYGLAAVALAQGVANVQMLRSTSFREKGGPMAAGSPYIVGERGPELVVPSSASSVVPNDKLGGGGNVTINVTTNDASGFDDLLTRSRGTLLGLMNQALNENGRASLV